MKVCVLKKLQVSVSFLQCSVICSYLASNLSGGSENELLTRSSLYFSKQSLELSTISARIILVKYSSSRSLVRFGLSSIDFVVG